MRVRILKPSPSTLQSACGCSNAWLVEPLREQKVGANPLMGWASGPDAQEGLKGRLSFSSLDAALAFAKEQGWSAEVIEPETRTIRPRSYVDNFTRDRRRSAR